MAALLAKLQNVLPFLLFAVLAVAGVATTTENPASGIFIAMLVIALFGAVAILFQKFLFQKVMKSRNSYQVTVFSSVLIVLPSGFYFKTRKQNHLK